MLGREVTPGDIAATARIKAYWATGEGRQKWINSPHPWTTLRDLLLKYVGPSVADGLASNIFKMATGHYPSSRVKGERL